MKRMLFNATHQEELRVAIVDGQKLIDLDIESAGKEQRKGNIYKGVITRIEPGLEACFVNYGEERHGFLPFKEVAKAYFKEGVDVRSARIQEALTEGQELIVQVDKEERGNKGAALTTFISLAGRYLVLMPNNPRGGGVSRRVEGEERQELREAIDQLNIPQGMSIIARTAGIGRSVEELQWDLSYLQQLWSAIDSAASANVAPILIYLESSLVIRAIRDYYSPDIGEILIDTNDIADQATAFMSVVMPDNVQRVKRYQDDIPLFSRFQIEHQIETAYSRHVHLPSGGSIVLDHTEALVSIDVNSARATRGSDIEETALRTNLEAAEEAARQLRLRDLGGLIVIDFIDMDDNKNQRAVENRLREALHVDRARVQMGKISKFGLMELSRQRLRPALNEGSHVTCPRCTGTGVIRDAESSALHVLRLLQEEAMKDNTAAVHAQVPVDVATFLLNEKRSDIAKIEARLKINLLLIPNKHLETPHHIIERLRHDDPRLEQLASSYELIQAPSTDETWSPRTHEIKPKPEALVKATTPSQPAPPATQKPAATKAASNAGASLGLFATIKQWLCKVFGSEEAAPEKTDKDTRHKGGARSGAKRTSQGKSADGQQRNRRPSRQSTQNRRKADAASDTQDRGNSRTTPENKAAQATDESGETRTRSSRTRRGRRSSNKSQNNLQQNAAQQTDTSVNEATATEAQTTARPSRQSRNAQQQAQTTQPAFIPVADQAAAELNQSAAEQPGVESTESRENGTTERTSSSRRRGRRGRRSNNNTATENTTNNLQETSSATATVESSAESSPTQPVESKPQVAQPEQPAQAPAAPVQTAAPEADKPAPAPVAEPATEKPAPVETAAVTAEPESVETVASEATVTTEVSAQVVPAAQAAPVAVSSVESTPETPAVQAAAPTQEATEPQPRLTQIETGDTQAVSAVEAQATTQVKTETSESVESTSAETSQALASVETQTTETTQVTVSASTNGTASDSVIKTDRQALHTLVQEIGLKWVESDPQRVAAASKVPYRAPTLGRAPRIQPPVTQVSLTQVETRTSA
ncbi:Rne/Rng family ribonuclease [Orrella sp. 11846]|uniref:Rne/Rng family ribonuclease n=1 Tax=Orrella sp. 11846 TaxID=3409913 RepID=UPI003B5BDA04